MEFESPRVGSSVFDLISFDLPPCKTTQSHFPVCYYYVIIALGQEAQSSQRGTIFDHF